MRRTLAFLLILAAASFPTGAESSGLGLAVSAKAMGSLAFGAGYLTPSVSIAWQPELFGIGLEVRALTNPAQADLYLVPFLEGRIGWFFLGVGLDLPVVLGTGASSSSSDLVPAATVGLDIPIAQIGPGTLGATVSADAVVTLIAASGSSSVLGDLLGTIVLTVLGIVKVTGGLYYSVAL